MDKLLTALEAAKLLSISDDGFEVLVEKYKIPHYKIAGKFIRFSQAEVEKYKTLLKIPEYNNTDKAISTKKVSNKIISNAIEYRKEELQSGRRIYEFLKFNDFYIVSFILIFLLLLYILRY